MSLRLKYDWGPSCHFFDEAMAAHKFSGTEHSILWILRRLTFGEPDFSRKGERKESVCISVGELKRRTGRAESQVRKALLNLEAYGVLIVLSPAHATKAKEYGINTRIDEWKVRRIGQIDKTKYPGSARRGCLSAGPLPAGTLSTCPQAPSRLPAGTLTESEPYSHKAADPTGEILRVKSKRSPIVPKGTEPVFEEIKTPAEALAKKGLTTPDAVIAAEGRFTKRFARGFSNRERTELAEAYFAASPDPRLLLAAWLAAIEPAYEDRRDRKRDPERARYVSNSPFRDVYTMAAEAYADYLADHQDRPERLTAA